MIIINDICSLCSSDYWGKAEKKVLEEHPKWFAKGGYVYSKYNVPYWKQTKEEYGKLNPGPTTCYENPQGYKICHDHLKDIMNKIEEYEKQGEEDWK